MRVASPCDAVEVVALGSGSEPFADPGDGVAHNTLVAALAFHAEVALSALAAVQALHDRSHEDEVADVQLALAGGGSRPATDKRLHHWLGRQHVGVDRQVCAAALSTIDLTLSASASRSNGLVITSMPCSRNPLPTIAFSA